MEYNEAYLIVNECIQNFLANTDSNLKEPLKYVLESSGKRLRACLCLSVMHSLSSEPSIFPMCLVPEFIHTASLIIDDLPSFDNALMRRGIECVHIKYSESIAYMTALSLITESVLYIHSKLPYFKTVYPAEEAYERCLAQVHSIAYNLSSKRAISGQINSLNTNLDSKLLLETLENKTSTFFEIALVLGWISGAGDLDKLGLIKKLAKHLGLCYQIYDDFLDYESDLRTRTQNYVIETDRLTAYTRFYKSVTIVENLINDLELSSPMFTHFLVMMKNILENNLCIQ